jgi:hypothetical protein
LGHTAVVAYAILRLLGDDPPTGRAHHRQRPSAVLVPAYLDSVERWLDAGAPCVGPPRRG